MDPDIFITIAFASFVFVAGMVGLILMTVMLVGSKRRAEGT
jgi:DMSO/TMAO reductase YedYZ heme-binding membrane subunit